MVAKRGGRIMQRVLAAAALCFALAFPVSLLSFNAGAYLPKEPSPSSEVVVLSVGGSGGALAATQQQGASASGSSVSALAGSSVRRGSSNNAAGSGPFLSSRLSVAIVRPEAREIRAAAKRRLSEGGSPASLREKAAQTLSEIARINSLSSQASSKRVPAYLSSPASRKAMERVRKMRELRAIRGFVALASKRDIDALRKDPSVLVFENRVFRLDPDVPVSPSAQATSMSIPLTSIGADYLFSRNITGSGVVVAVLDTGIDYTHPDFGNCSSVGAGCRVASGYDFVNNDADPVDDNGHGTHVAAIIGAQGSFRGVAPNVTLMAVKVCDSAGYCSTSAMVQGLDYAYANGADVIHMSIGGAAAPNDPFADATSVVATALSELGVPVVISAGNIGPGYNTIAAPGSAYGVITVGASNDQDTPDISDDSIPAFSARGPSAFGRFDPDVVAPGYNICAAKASGTSGTTCGDSSHVLKSGTSMSAPFVSGSIALMLDYNSSWSLGEIRKRLIGSAYAGVSENVFEQGAGLINVSRAVYRDFFFSYEGNPFAELYAKPGENSSYAFAGENHGNASIFFNLSATSFKDMFGRELGAAFSLPSSLSLEPGSQEFYINISLPLNASPGMYQGYFVFNSSKGEAMLPVVLSVPVIDSAVVSGYGDDSCSGCWNSVVSFGDWLYFPLSMGLYSSIKANLSWSSSTNDLDLYLFAPSGHMVAVSGNENTNTEYISASGVLFDNYWLAVHSYYVASQTWFNLSVTGASELNVSPQSLVVYLSPNSTSQLNLSVKNDASPKNLSFMVFADNSSLECSSSLNVSNTQGSISVPLNFSSWCPRMLGPYVVNVSARWQNSSVDVDLYLLHRSGSSWYSSTLVSQHVNSLLSDASESLYLVDLRFLSENYPDLAIGLKSDGSAVVNVSVRASFLSSDVPFISVFPSGVSLQPYEGANLTLSVNSSSLSVGVYRYSLRANYSNKRLFEIPVSVVVEENQPPVILSYYPNSSVSLYENSSQLFSQNSSDRQPLLFWWYLDGVLVSTNSSWTYSPGFSDSGNHSVLFVASDGQLNASVSWNVSVLNLNRAPVFLEPLPNRTINESQLFSLNVSFYDPDNDSVSVLYSFPLNSSGQWLPNSSQSGLYLINVTISDAYLNTSDSFWLTVLDLPDFDRDGIADIYDDDDDNDGVPDSLDRLKGNASFINTSSLSPRLLIDGSENTSIVLNETRSLKILDGNATVVSFSFDFSSSALDMSRVTVERYANSSGYVMVKGLNLSGGNKTVYVDRVGSSTDYICVKDREDVSLFSVSSKCNSPGEYFVPCDGLPHYGYTCTANSSFLVVSGLTHSEVSQQCADIDSDGYFIEGCGSGTDCNDNDNSVNPGQEEVCDDEIDNNCDGQVDEGCQQQSSGGSGGGGGGGFVRAQNSQNNESSSLNSSSVNESVSSASNSSSNSTLVINQSSSQNSSNSSGPSALLQKGEGLGVAGSGPASQDQAEGDGGNRGSNAGPQLSAQQSKAALSAVGRVNGFSVASVKNSETEAPSALVSQATGPYEFFTFLGIAFAFFAGTLLLVLGRGVSLLLAEAEYFRFSRALRERFRHVERAHVRSVHRFIKHGVAHGLSIQEIEDLLLAKGWDRELVREIISRFAGSISSGEKKRGGRGGIAGSGSSALFPAKNRPRRRVASRRGRKSRKPRARK